MIDARAIIDPSARIAAGVSIAPYVIVGADVEIGEGTHIGPHTLINKNTKIGRNNYIDAFVAVGGDPQHTQYKEETTYLEIGDNNVIREFCTLHRGTIQGGGVTRVGNHNLIMAYAHIAHDCNVGNEVILANNTSLAGHVHVEDFVNFSAFCGVHQFVTVGAYSFFGSGTKVAQDIPPYLLVTGNPGTPRGLNLVGLKRQGFDEKTLRVLRRAYSLVYRQGLRLQDAVEQLLPMSDTCPQLRPLITALQRAKRGIAR